MYATGWTPADAEAITTARGEEFCGKLLPAALTARTDRGLDVRYGGVAAQGVTVLLLDKQGRAQGPESPDWATLAGIFAGFGLALQPDGIVELAKAAKPKPPADA